MICNKELSVTVQKVCLVMSNKVAGVKNLRKFGMRKNTNVKKSCRHIVLNRTLPMIIFVSYLWRIVNSMAVISVQR